MIMGWKRERERENELGQKEGEISEVCVQELRDACVSVVCLCAHSTYSKSKM